MSRLRAPLPAAVCAWLALWTPEALAEDAPLTLEQAVSLAAERNETVLAAQAQAQAADARVARARAFFFPDLTITGTYRMGSAGAGGGQQGGFVSNGLSATGTARLTLFDARGFPLFRVARLSGEASAMDARETRRQVAFDAAGAFLSTLGAQQVADAARQRLEFARKSLQDARARAEGGLASSNDVTLAELEVATAESQLVDTQGQAQTNRLELGYLLVGPMEGALAVPEQLLAEAARPVDSLRTVATGALERRPDILSSRLRVQAQEAAALEPLARLLPSLSASGQYRVTAEPDPTGRQGAGSLSVDLTWSLFDGGERYAERRESLALARALSLQNEALTRRVDVGVARAEVSLRTAQAALATSQVAVQAARKNVEETGILYRQGLSTALAVADASVRLFEAEVALARARFALGAALLELRDAVGLDPLGKEP